MFLIFCFIFMVDCVSNPIKGIDELEEAILSENAISVKKLITNEGNQVDFCNDNGPNALHRAAEIRNPLILKMVLAVLRDTNPHVEQRTPLPLEPVKGHKKTVAGLLESGAKIEASGKCGRTALHEAAEKRRKGVLPRILSKRDSPSELATDRKDYPTISSLLDNSSLNKQRIKNDMILEITGLLKLLNSSISKAMSDTSSFDPKTNYIPAQDMLNRIKDAILSDNITAVEELLNTVYVMENRQSSCQTPLRYAVKNCRLTIVKLLLEYGTNANENYDCNDPIVSFIVSEGQLPSTEVGCPQFLGMKSCGYDLLNLLIDYGADVNAANCHGRTPLHFAAEFNNSKAAEILINAGALIEKKDENCKSPLLVSVEYKNIEMLKLLLSKNASVYGKQCEKSTYPLHIATTLGNIEMMDLLLKHGANIEQASSVTDFRPIHEASKLNKSEAVKFLIMKGAEVNAKDRMQSTSLHMAACKGYLEVGEVLLDAGADIEAKIEEQLTPLLLAAKCGEEEFSIFLLKRGANFRAKSEDGRTALHYASRENNVELLHELLEVYPEGVNLVDNEGKTPLFWASFSGSIEMFLLLIKWGADPHTKTHLNMTILHGAADNGNHETAKKALRIGIDINAADANGNTALYFAANGGHVELYSFFLKEGADPDIRSNLNETLLHWAVKKGYVNLIQEIIKVTKNIDPQDSEGMTPLYRAAVEKNYIAFQDLFDNGANPLIPRNDGDTILHLTAYNGDIKIMEIVLNRTVNIEYQDRRGRTPLYLAAEMGKKDIFILLINNNGNLNTSTRDGKALIHGAVIGGNYDIVQIVVNSTDNINAQDNEGRTALFIAASMASRSIFYYLLEHGADMSIKTHNGRTILHAAAIGGDYAITNTVLERSNMILVRDEQGKSALFHAAERKKKFIFKVLMQSGVGTMPAEGGWTLLHSAAKGGDVDIFLSVENITENINIQNDEGETALFVSVINSNRAIFELLLNSFADPDIPNKNGYTILHWASHFGDIDFASKILQVSDKSVNSRDVGGKTPLHWAVNYGHSKLCEHLLKFNADPRIENIFGYSPVSIAAAKGTVNMMKLFSDTPYNGEVMLGVSLAWGNREVMNYLLEDRVKPTEKNKLHFAAARGDNKELEKLFRLNANSKRERFNDITSEIAKEYMKYTMSMGDDDVYMINPWQFKLSPLHMAILFNGSVQTVELIINMTKTTTIDLIKHRGTWTPLDMAAFCGKHDVVNYFLKFGIPASFTGEDSWTCTHKAAWGGHNTIIKVLVENGANLNVPDVLGRTSLHIAAMRGYNATVNEILQLSKDSINTRDRYMFTPLHLAEIYGHQKYFESLAVGTITLDAPLRYALKDPGLVASSLRNHTRTVEVLLENGADPNAQDRVFGWTALHWSAAIGHLEVARILVEHGARVNLPSWVDQTPMYLARFWWRSDLYSFLKEKEGVW